MLSQSWGCRANPRLALGVLYGRVYHPNGSTALMVYFHDHVAGKCVLMIESPLYIVDSRVRHSLALKMYQPLLCCSLLCYFLNHALQVVSICDSVGISLVLGVIFPFRPA